VTFAVALASGVFLAHRYLSIDFLAAQETKLRQIYASAPGLVLGATFLIYVAVTGLSLPGATLMTLVIGWFFGFWLALIVVSFASTSGATLAFLLSRYFLREAIQTRFTVQLAKVNEAFDREGVFYLFTLRLIPAVPFFVLNAVMGLTKIRTRTYWWVSQLGMLAGTGVYVYAGATLPSLHQIADPSLMRVTDIADWDLFTRRLREARGDTPAAEIAARLSKQDRALLAGELTAAERLRLTKSLNSMLAFDDLALTSAWHSGREMNLSVSRQRQRDKLRTSINRSVLVFAFPDVVLPPQPILNGRLLLAFAMLGLFPLIVKTLLGRFRSEEAPPG